MMRTVPSEPPSARRAGAGRAAGAPWWSTRVWLGTALALLLYPFLSRGGAQSSPPSQDLVLKENVKLVVVPVTVKDKSGNLVDDLTQSDFRIFEDHHERPVQYFSTDLVPLSAVVLLDTGMSATSVAAVRASVRSVRDAF